MKRLVFMNHRIRDPQNEKPPITLQTDGRQRFAHRIEVYDRHGDLIAAIDWSKTGNPAVTTHQVRAWVEIGDPAHARVKVRR